MRKLIRSALIAIAAIFGVILVLCVLFAASFRLIYVDGGSMTPTLETGDWIAANRLQKPERGDIVLTNTNNYYHARLIKRLIAFGGETVDIDYETGVITVDGQPLDEPYMKGKDKSVRGGDVTFPLTVPEGCVFLLGDNRTNSTDSRYAEIGCVPESDLVGPVVVRLLPAPAQQL